MENKLRPLENLHILLWLLKDICWVMLAKWPGIIMIIPTILLALYITWLSRKDHLNFYHNLAIVFWISANSTWMVGEFFFEDGLRTPAKVFFGIGLLIVACYYWQYPPWKSIVEDSKNLKS